MRWWCQREDVAAGQELTFAGVTVLGFNDHGQVIDRRDYDNHVQRREAPDAGW